MPISWLDKSALSLSKCPIIFSSWECFALLGGTPIARCATEITLHQPILLKIIPEGNMVTWISKGKSPGLPWNSGISKSPPKKSQPNGQSLGLPTRGVPGKWLLDLQIFKKKIEIWSLTSIIPLFFKGYFWGWWDWAPRLSRSCTKKRLHHFLAELSESWFLSEKAQKKDLIQYLVERNYLFLAANVGNNDGQGLLFHLLLKYHTDATPIKATSKQKKLSLLTLPQLKSYVSVHYMLNYQSYETLLQKIASDSVYCVQNTKYMYISCIYIYMIYVYLSLTYTWYVQTSFRSSFPSNWSTPQLPPLIHLVELCDETIDLTSWGW